ncbi:MAG TPA: hypothetical protein VIT91_10635, partial [Chthoniobacterales bacterium]
MEKTKRTRSRRRLGGEEIERLLGQYRGSGRTQHEFAAAHGIGLSTLTKWLRTEKRRALAGREREPGAMDLVEVTLAGSRPPGAVFSSGNDYDYALEMTGCGRLHVRRGFDGG